MESSLQKIRNCTSLFHLQCPRFTLLALMNYTQSTWRDLALPASKLKRHWRPNPPSIEQYTGKLIYHFTTHSTRFVHSYEIFLRGSCNSLFFKPPTFLHRQVYSCTVELWCLYHWYLEYHWCVKVSQNHCSIIHIFTTSITLGYLKDLC